MFGLLVVAHVNCHIAIASATGNPVKSNEANDSLLKTITITGCEVTNDLSFAKVYFTSLSALEKEELEKEMAEAAKYIRGEVSKQIEIRHTPELRFIYDESVEYVRLLREAGIPTEFHVVPKSIHGFLRARFISPGARETFEKLSAALRNALGTTQPASNSR